MWTGLSIDATEGWLWRKSYKSFLNNQLQAANIWGGKQTKASALMASCKGVSSNGHRGTLPKQVQDCRFKTHFWKFTPTCSLKQYSPPLLYCSVCLKPYLRLEETYTWPGQACIPFSWPCKWCHSINSKNILSSVGRKSILTSKECQSILFCCPIIGYQS